MRPIDSRVPLLKSDPRIQVWGLSSWTTSVSTVGRMSISDYQFAYFNNSIYSCKEPEGPIERFSVHSSTGERESGLCANTYIHEGNVGSQILLHRTPVTRNHRMGPFTCKFIEGLHMTLAFPHRMARGRRSLCSWGRIAARTRAW